MSTQPSAHNLLQLYRQHRDEIDATTDPTLLFILAYANHVGEMRLSEIARELGQSSAALNKTLRPLYRAQLVTEAGEMLRVTPLGKRVLEELGFSAPLVPPKPSQSLKPSRPPAPPGAGLTLIGFVGAAIIVLIGAFIVGVLVLPNIVNPPRLPPTRAPLVITQPPLTLWRETPTEIETLSTLAPVPSRTPTPSQTPTFTPTPSRTPTFTPISTTTRTLSPTPVGRITGAVVRASNQKAIAGARIQIGSGQTVTSRDGSYGFSELAPGTYSVTASATGYNAQTQSVTVPSGGTTRLDFQLTKAITAKGEATLRPWDCFNLDSPGEYFAAPSNPEFFTCPTRADIQWIPKDIRLLNGASVVPASPPYTYESCPPVAALPGAKFAPVLDKYYCVYTTNDQTALVRFTQIDSTNRVTFSWWLY